MPNGMMKYVPSCHPMEKPNDLEAGWRICCHPIQMSGQGIVGVTPLKFNTAFVGLFKYTTMTHCPCDIPVLNRSNVWPPIHSKFIPSKPCLRRSLLLISISFGSEASMNISSLLNEVWTLKFLKFYKILNSNLENILKYPQLAVRIHRKSSFIPFHVIPLSDGGRGRKGLSRSRTGSVLHL